MMDISFQNGMKMPILGFGTYFLNVMDTEEAVYTALMAGYRHLDTAKWYHNEKYVRRAIERSEIPREELFITGKVECKGYEETRKDILLTIQDLGVGYLDLLLIHWPTYDIVGTYRALEEAYDRGLVRSIGLSNFNQEQCEEILKVCRVFPQVNQIETHIYFQEKKMNRYLTEKGICHESWAPFAEGYLGMLGDAVLKEIANHYQKSVAQIILRFLIEKEIVVIPKSTNPLHITENMDVFDFSLSEEDRKTIERLDQKRQYSPFPESMKVETNY